jgi:predicted solute-binding protein
LITSGRTREQIRKNIKTKERDLTLQVNQKCISTNQYEALEAYNEMHRNAIDTNTITANELTDISRSQNDKYNKSGKHNTTTKESLENSAKSTI